MINGVVAELLDAPNPKAGAGAGVEEPNNPPVGAGAGAPNKPPEDTTAPLPRFPLR